MSSVTLRPERQAAQGRLFGSAFIVHGRAGRLPFLGPIFLTAQRNNAFVLCKGYAFRLQTGIVVKISLYEPCSNLGNGAKTKGHSEKK